jgi:hypothetical protein
MNLVFDNRGTGVTITENMQLPFRALASVASHVTIVCPFGNSLPDAGLHVTFTGGSPSCAGGVSKFAVGCPCPWCERSAISAGQLTVGGFAIGVGGLGLLRPPQQIAPVLMTSTIILFRCTGLDIGRCRWKPSIMYNPARTC